MRKIFIDHVDENEAASFLSYSLEFFVSGFEGQQNSLEESLVSDVVIQVLP